MVFRFVLFAPLRWIGRRIFKPIMLFMYERYLPARHTVHTHVGRAKNSWLYPLTARYIVHVLIIILTVVVTTHSLSAQEIRSEDFGKGSILSTLAGREDDEIVETADSISMTSHYADTRGTVKYSPEPVNLESDQLLVTASGTSLIKTASPTTSVVRQTVSQYTVRGGDTISTIASAFGISTNTILWANNLNETDFIKPGQTLKIPPTSGVVHTVASGDTISSIAKKYKADENKILEFNKLPDASAIEVGQALIIPGGSIEPPPPVRVATTTTSSGSIFSTNAPPAARVSGSRLQWPTVGHKINQYFTWRHTGIDIEADTGTPIYAAEGGRVIVSQGGWNGGYGNYIIIDHGNGMQTVYGHASRLYVTAGQTVTRGQTIAGAGTTGRSTGVHLHFEVRINGARLNPFSYL